MTVLMTMEQANPKATDFETTILEEPKIEPFQNKNPEELTFQNIIPVIDYGEIYFLGWTNPNEDETSLIFDCISFYFFRLAN